MSYADVRHHYEDPPDEADYRDKEIADTKKHIKALIGLDVDEAVEVLKDVRTKAKEEIARLAITGHDPQDPATTYWQDIVNKIGEVLGH